MAYTKPTIPKGTRDLLYQNILHFIDYQLFTCVNSEQTALYLSACCGKIRVIFGVFR